MAKKGSKSSGSGRRGSLATTTNAEAQNDNITIATHESDHSKFSVSKNNTSIEEKNILHWAELKQDTTSAEEIRNKVRRLPLDNVLPLLLELLTQFDVQQARDTELTEWIKTVLLIHTAYFMTLPEVVQRLSSLYKELDDRLTVYPKLLAIHGRLDLIQNQIDARNRKEEESEEEESEEEGEESDNDQVFSESDDEEEEDNEDDEDDNDDLMDMDDDEEV